MMQNQCRYSALLVGVALRQSVDLEVEREGEVGAGGKGERSSYLLLKYIQFLFQQNAVVKVKYHIWIFRSLFAIVRKQAGSSY